MELSDDDVQDDGEVYEPPPAQPQQRSDPQPSHKRMSDVLESFYSDLASLDDLPAAPPAATVTAGSEVASLSSTPSGTPMQCRSPSAHHEDDAPVTVASSSSVAALALRLDDVHDERSNSPFRTSDGDDNLDKRKRKVTFFSIFTMLRF